MALRVYQQETRTVDGVELVVRRIPQAYVIFSPCGKFLARVSSGSLDKWLRHYAKEGQNNGRKEVPPDTGQPVA